MLILHKDFAAAVRDSDGDGQLLRRFKENAGIDAFPTEDLHRQLTVIACLAWVPRLLSNFP